MGFSPFGFPTPIDDLLAPDVGQRNDGSLSGSFSFKSQSGSSAKPTASLDGVWKEPFSVQLWFRSLGEFNAPPLMWARKNQVREALEQHQMQAKKR
jgi:hypothetical protein